MTDCEKQVHDTLLRLADMIGHPPLITEDGLDPVEEGLTWSDELDAYVDAEGDEVETHEMTASDFLADVLDIEYTVSGHSRDYLGAHLCITFGGPGIYIDTRRRVIEGFWAGDHQTRGYVDNIGLDEFCGELFDIGG